MRNKIPWVRIEDARIRENAKYLVRYRDSNDYGVFDGYWGQFEDCDGATVTHVAEITEPIE